MNGRKRTVQIKFRVTEEERAFIEQKMQLVPTRNMEAYLRKMAIDGYIIQIDHADIKAMTAEIQKIGVNVNQIAKRVNATGSVYQEDDGIKIFRLIGAFLWSDKLCLNDVLYHDFKGLPVFFIHCQEEAGKHNDNHCKCRHACSRAVFEQKEKR